MRYISLLIILLTNLSYASYEKANNRLSTSQQCLQYFAHYESKYNLPGKLLHSIALAESGRWLEEEKMFLPWPWTVNQGGKSYYFDSKIEAIEAINKMIKKGITNIDVGCMQINLGYHSRSFLGLHHALEPKHNVEFGASFLKKHYDKSSDWRKAIASYHSMSSLGLHYYDRVMKMWNLYSTNSSAQVKKEKKIHTNSAKMDPRRLKSSLVVD